MLLSQFMNARNLARAKRHGSALAPHTLDHVADTVEALANTLRTEAALARENPDTLVGNERRKVALLQGIQALTDVSNQLARKADTLAALAHSPEIGASSRTLASALGVSTNTAIKRMRTAGEVVGDG